MSDCGCAVKDNMSERLKGRNLLRLIRNIPKKEHSLVEDADQDEGNGENGDIVKTQTLSDLHHEDEYGDKDPPKTCKDLSVEAEIEMKRLEYLLKKIEELRCNYNKINF